MNAIRPWLYVGKYRKTLNASLLAANRISAMLQLAEAVTQPNITSIYLSVEDGEPLSGQLLQQGVEFVVSEKQRGKSVLIACGAGISRAATFATAVLKKAENLSLLKAIRTVSLHHPESLPHPVLWESLCQYYNEKVSVHDMLNALH